jgi:hypothetical protein
VYIIAAWGDLYNVDMGEGLPGCTTISRDKIRDEGKIEGLCGVLLSSTRAESIL